MAETLQNVVAILLAISLTSERLVAIAKTLFPRWLAEERLTATLEVDPIRDRWRRIRVMAIALLASYATVGLVNEDFGLLAPFSFGHTFAMPVVLVAILASGGSAMWSSLLGYARAAKDLRSRETASRKPTDAQRALPRAGRAAPGWDEMAEALREVSQPGLEIPGRGQGQ